MIHRASWLAIALAVAACSKTGADPGLGSGGMGGAGLFDAGPDLPPFVSGFDASIDRVDEWCGDGVLEVEQGETCDDGDREPGDGCSTLCQVECRASCGSCSAGGPCVGTAVCGDGIRNGIEQCDDGNLVAGDGCTGACAVEDGWYCPIAGLPCVPICGDGKVTGPETCDDHNDTDGDGCSSACLTEPTDARCGDGVVQGAEACEAHGGAFTAFPCAIGCRYLHYCGDGNVDAGEECDLGVPGNVASYGDNGCTPACKRAHYCGDGIVDPGEACDFGENNNDDPNVSACPKTCQVNLP